VTAKYLGDDDRVVSKYYQRVTDANEAAALDAMNRILKQGKADTAKRNAG